MFESGFPWGILFFLGVKLYIACAKDKGTTDTVEEIRPVLSSERIPVQYYSNGFAVDEPLHIHYLRTLSLLDKYGHINHEVVKEASKKKLMEIEDWEFFDRKSIDEIMAAKQFLHDQINHVVWYN